jgi:hypothetical protein
MRAVAEDTIVTVLAATEIDRAVFLSRVGSRGEAASLVGAVAKGLRGTLAARAPVVGFTSFNGDWDWGFLSDDGVRHKNRFLVLKYLLRSLTF